MFNPYIRLSNALQVFFLKRPGFLSRRFLSLFYTIDVIFYSLFGTQAFLMRRRKLLGPNFAALGKLILGSYEEVAKRILAPQKRGAYLGRLRLIEDRFSEYFLLFVSDKGAGGGDVFQQVYDLASELVLSPAEARAAEPWAEAEIERLVEEIHATGNPPSAKELTPILQRGVVQYMMRAILDVKVTPEQADTLGALVFSSSPRQSMVLARARPFAGRKIPRKVRKGEALFIELVQGSPAMAGFQAANENGLDYQAFSQALVRMVAIAGFVGTNNLATSVLTRVPPDSDFDLDDPEQVERVVLETARRWPPVNNVNVIAEKPVTFPIRGKPQTFPAGTVLALSIGIASIDSQEFPKPLEFDPGRPNLCPGLLSFNSVGDEGSRRCPGRGVAVAMNVQLLKAWRKKVAAG